MNAEARSVFVFGVYLAVVGLTLVVQPSLLLPLFGIPATEEIWLLRVSGTLVVIIGFFCIQAGRFDWAEFYRGSITTRLWVMACFSSYVILGIAPRELLIVATIDFLGATWTALALRSKKASCRHVDDDWSRRRDRRLPGSSDRP
jgi:hypothetical protein